jgi:hypothetical protein
MPNAWLENIFGSTPRKRHIVLGGYILVKRHLMFGSLFWLKSRTQGFHFHSHPPVRGAAREDCSAHLGGKRASTA